MAIGSWPMTEVESLDQISDEPTVKSTRERLALFQGNRKRTVEPRNLIKNYYFLGKTADRLLFTSGKTLGLISTGKRIRLKKSKPMRWEVFIR